MRRLVPFLCAALVGVLTFKRFPFPDGNYLLQLILFHKPLIFYTLRWSWIAMLFSTPALLFSGIFSMVFIFFNTRTKTAQGTLPPFPLIGTGQNLHVVVGELQHPRQHLQVASPRWLTIPDRGLFTGIAIFGAIGTGKTTCCMRPFAEQILSYCAADREKRIGGIVLEVKGDFCHQIRKLLDEVGRGDDYIELSLSGEYCYNPLHNDLDAYTLAYSVSSLINNLFGKGKEPFWQQAYTNLVKFIILLHIVVDEYVTLFDVYRCAIGPDALRKKIEDGDQFFTEMLAVHADAYVAIDAGDYLAHEELGELKWETTADGRMRTLSTDDLVDQLEQAGIGYEVLETAPPPDFDALLVRHQRFEAVQRWYNGDWLRIDTKLRSSIVEGVSVFLSLFDDNPQLKRVFCPPKEAYDPALNHDGRYGKVLAGFGDLIETGKVLALNFPISANPGIARAVGVFMKQDFQRAMLMRIPQMELEPERYFREALFLCDEYQAFATVGESDPTGDEKFFALSRQSKCIPIVATQSISSLKTSLPGDTWRTLLQTFRTKLFLSLSDDFSAEIASKLCGKDDQMMPHYSISENDQDARISTLNGRAMAHKAALSVNKNFSIQTRPLFEPKIFADLKNAQCIALAYDGLNPLPPRICYLKPYYLDRNMPYAEQVAKGLL